jgi:hypothetical protein
VSLGRVEDGKKTERNGARRERERETEKAKSGQKVDSIINLPCHPTVYNYLLTAILDLLIH